MSIACTECGGPILVPEVETGCDRGDKHRLHHHQSYRVTLAGRDQVVCINVRAFTLSCEEHVRVNPELHLSWLRRGPRFLVWSAARRLQQWAQRRSLAALDFDIADPGDPGDPIDDYPKD
jgi:hypothetical protein